MSSLSSSTEKKVASKISDAVQEELDYVVSNKITQHQANIRNLDSLAKGTNEKNKLRLLQEAQANLEFSADTGYASELRRDFSLLSLLGIGFGITNSWFGVSGSLVAGIMSGGPMVITYGIMILAVIATCIGITLSEMASAFPNASGQIYWTMRLAPPRWSRLLSYITGALSWLGSLFTAASVTMAFSTAVMGMYVLVHPDKTIQSWQVFIAYEITNLSLIVFNIWEKPLPLISTVALYTSLSSFIIIIITVLAMHEGDFQKPSFVFVEFQNGTGWSSGAIAFIVGLINPNWSFSCLDAATHIAEESLNPAVQVPQAILLTVIVGFLTAFPYCIAIFFCIKDLDAIFNSNTGVPIMDIFYQSTNSKAAALGLQMLVMLTAYTCNIAIHTWQARICWSFARDGGLPFSKFLARVNSKTGTVINAHLFSCFWNGIIGFIYLGSSTAFNSVLVSCVTFLLLSYLVPTVLFVFKRNQIKPGPFFLKKYNIGLCCNLVLCAWAIIAFIFYNFPYTMPVSGGNMNYSSAVFGIIFVICSFDWMLRGRKEYIGIQERELIKNELTSALTHQLSNIESTMSPKPE
ncbi:hypothetical protein KGF56_004804 [Candida oxycetoniae]|uniref:Choline transport protein n=1 Tax=Candida oxycetoniae TaxID=497107 RepID=A0AAI9STL6_9ASCO|nr:uncharacterized protein KGF56_004804 [Candida oxycetoniae]KAI3402396.2 hypothetical protein KGF56_004804 [Candida oxycetoniae]